MALPGQGLKNGWNTYLGQTKFDVAVIAGMITLMEKNLGHRCGNSAMVGKLKAAKP